MVQNDTSRRDLLRLGVAAGTTSVLGGCSLFGSRKADVVAQPQNHTISLTAQESADLLASEGGLLVKPEGLDDKILVVNDKAGALHAVSSVCTHQGCDVLYDKDLGHVRCPCHGSQFGLDGHNVKGPAERPLRQYDVRNDRGRIVIRL